MTVQETSADAGDVLSDLVELDPRVALRPGRLDAGALWAVYLMRKAFLPLAFLGALVLSLTGRDGESLDGVDTVGEVLEAVRSPLVILLVAVTLRIAATVLGFALAYPLSHRAAMVMRSQVGRWSSWGRWMDRLHVTRAYRSLRWTKAVRDVAAGRLGTTARPLRLVELALTWSLPALLVGSVVAHVVVST